MLRKRLSEATAASNRSSSNSGRYSDSLIETALNKSDYTADEAAPAPEERTFEINQSTKDQTYTPNPKPNKKKMIIPKVTFEYYFKYL